MALFDFFGEPKRPRPKFSPKEKDALFKEKGGKCNGCGKKYAKRNLTVNPIQPFSDSGHEVPRQARDGIPRVDHHEERSDGDTRDLPVQDRQELTTLQDNQASPQPIKLIGID